MRKEVIKHLVKNKIGKSNVYDIYDRKKIIYIHIPKAAGNSICRAIYGEDPQHFSAKELKIINNRKFELYPKVAFVRNPLERVISTYQYSKKHILSQPGTSISFMKNYSSFDDFVEHGLTASLVTEHYFFWSQDRYLGKDIDYVGKFESITSDFNNLTREFEFDAELKHQNKSQPIIEPLELKMCNLEKVLELYKVDFDRFNYCNIPDYSKINII